MNTEKNVSVPDFEGEEMKMPENTDIQPEQINQKEPSIVNLPLLLTLTLLLILILGGMYYWFFIIQSTSDTPVDTPVTRPTFEENNEPESTTAEARTEINNVTSPSDELSAIENDLDSTLIDENDIMSDLNIIDNEIESEAGTEI